MGRADLIENPTQKYFGEEPSAHVARLFLAPNDLCLLETRKPSHQRLCWEWIKLLDAQEINVIYTAFLALFIKVVVDLAGTQDNAADFVVGNQFDRLRRWEIKRRRLRIIP